MLRVYHLAKEFHLPRHVLIDKIKSKTGNTLFSLSTLTPDLVSSLRAELAPPPPPEPPKVAEPAAAPASAETKPATPAKAADASPSPAAPAKSAAKASSKASSKKDAGAAAKASGQESAAATASPAASASDGKAALAQAAAAPAQEAQPKSPESKGGESKAGVKAPGADAPKAAAVSAAPAKAGPAPLKGASEPVAPAASGPAKPGLRAGPARPEAPRGLRGEAPRPDPRARPAAKQDEPTGDAAKKRENLVTLPMPEVRAFSIVSRASEHEARLKAEADANRQRLLDERAKMAPPPVAQSGQPSGVAPSAETLADIRARRAREEEDEEVAKRGDSRRRGRKDRDEDVTTNVNEFLAELSAPGAAAFSSGPMAVRAFPGRARKPKTTPGVAGAATPGAMQTGRQKSLNRKRKKVPQAPVRPDKVTLEMPVTIGALSTAFAVRAAQLIAFAMKPPHSRMLRINDFVPEELALAMALDQGIEVELVKQKDLEAELVETAKSGSKEKFPLRAPVVTFLGHVDHGKTTLLDTIRKTKVAAQEAGGITQHVTAYRVETEKGPITFVDTPGHAAFTAMRSRGAGFTDVVVLVVAADDGVMPQTEEAINHARAAGVPIVVALTKIDLPGTNIDRVKSQLAVLGLQAEDWGGQTQVCPLSARTGQGISEFLEMLALEAELLDLRADPNAAAHGVIIESYLDEGKGNMAVALVTQGTLHRGDLVVAGTGLGKVRALYSDTGRRIHDAGPSVPVHVIGLNALPAAGDKFYVVDDAEKAKEITTKRLEKLRTENLAARSTRVHVTLENLAERLQKEQQHEIRIIIKADVQGSIMALKQIIEESQSSQIQLRILHSAVGGINESDVILADAWDAIIIGFHVVTDERARNLAREKGVDVRLYQVIYRIKDELRASMEGMLTPEEKEVEIGRVIVRATFKSSAVGTIAGCYVEDGKVERNCKIRVSRDGIIRHEGSLQSLKRFKDDVREVAKGFECGIKIRDFDDIKTDDRIVCYQMVQVARTLD